MNTFLTLTENLKSTTHFIFEKMEVHDGMPTNKQNFLRHEIFDLALALVALH